MKTINDTPAELRELGALAPLFAWTDRHPKTATALLWLQIIALVYIVLTYNFTIPAYK
jgi:hypothetical protein